MQNTLLQLPWLVVNYFHVLQMFPSKFNEVLMCGILAHVVISIFFTLEFHYEAVGERSLRMLISIEVTY